MGYSGVEAVCAFKVSSASSVGCINSTNRLRNIPQGLKPGPFVESLFGPRPTHCVGSPAVPLLQGEDVGGLWFPRSPGAGDLGHPGSVGELSSLAPGPPGTRPCYKAGLPGRGTEGGVGT